MPLEDSCRKFLVSWKMTSFYYKTVFCPTEINMKNCLLILVKNLMAAFLNDTNIHFAFIISTRKNPQKFAGYVSWNLKIKQ